MKIKTILLTFVFFIILFTNTASADIVTLRTDGAGTYTEWSVLIGGPNYAAVYTENGFSMLVSSATQKNDTYNYENTTYPTQRINYVQISMYNRYPNWGYLAPLVYDGSTLYKGATEVVNGNSAKVFTFTTNPITGLEWTVDELNSYEFGLSGNDGSSYMHISEVKLLVSYDNIVPTNLQNTTGNHWINYTWSPSIAGTNTDSYNVSFNETWFNGSSNSINQSVGAHGYGNITVYGYNTTYGLSTTNITDSVQLLNNAPSIPSIITPLDNTNVLSHSVIINISSTDLDSDSLTYYIYGDTVDGTTLLNISSNGLYTWNVEDYDVYYWKAQAYDGYEYSANTSLQQFQLIAPPDLQTPTNTSTHTYSFPPLLHDMTFAWQDISAPAYKYQIAKDSNFNLISKQNTITTNTTTIALTKGDYYWRVYAYETSTGTYSNASDVWQFTINETNGGGTTTAIDGVVYEVTTAGSVAVDGALVNIWNNTWSDSMLVGQNGYYYFDGAKDGTYSLRSTKTGYTDSSIELVTVSANVTTTRNILLQSTSGSGQQYVDHYVLFTVKTLWGTLYSDVEVNVYLNGAVIPLYTGTTGTDGSIGFELDENQKYRITFIDASQGINEEITIYPVKSEYPVYIIKSLLPRHEDVETTEVVVSITQAEINSTHAYINVTYTDAMAETTDLNIFINQSNEADPQNQTVITSAALGATSSVTHSFLISDYRGQAYFINIGATHTTFDTISRTYSVRFDGMAEDYGFERFWLWLGVGGLMFLAGIFKSSKAEKGALIVCIAGWIFVGMGLFDALGSSALTGMKAGLGLATVLAVMANMAKRNRDETV